MIEFNLNNLDSFYNILWISEGLKIYSDACIIMLAVALAIFCNMACMVYHIFMKKDEENNFRLLNIFYGQLGKPSKKWYL